MSLKAKIEAVIYAAEEPVTLAQLVSLLGQEAQRELDVLAGRQQQLDLPEDDTADEPAAEADGEAASETASEEAAPRADADQDATGAAETSQQAEQAIVSADAGSAAEKRAARDAERRLREYLGSIVARLVEDYATSERGLEVREVAGGLRMATKPEYHDAVRGFVRSLKPPLKLTLQALETLAVVAYKQPVTSPEVSEIRGVDSGGVLGSLITRKLVTTAGRKQVVGRPILYKTTKDFLLRFGLKDLSELPSIEEFEKMASELDYQEQQQETPMPSNAHSEEEERILHESLEAEKNVTEPQADGDSDSLTTEEGARPAGELPAVDGRITIQPPNHDQLTENPSAAEAAIQSNQGENS